MQNLRVLLVDDDDEFVAFARLKLSDEAAHFSVAHASSGPECIEYLKDHPVDCILSGYRMPGMDGMELLHTLRSNNSDVPFILVTGNGNEELARDAFRNGAYDYFTKDAFYANLTRVTDSVEQSVGRRRLGGQDASHITNEKVLRDIIDKAPVCIKVITVDGIVLMMNQAGLKMIGAESLDQVKGKSVFSLVVPEYLEAFKAFGEKVCRTGAGSLEFEMASIDGNRFWLETRAVPIHNEEGEITALLCITIDIGERKRAEEALQESEERFRTLFESANDAILLNDNGIYVDCNSKAVEYYGFKNKSELIGRNPAELAPLLQPDGVSSQEKVARLVKDTLAGIPQRFYWQYQRPDGSMMDADASLNRVFLNNKYYIQGIVRDITESKRTEEALRESEERFRTLFESADDGIFLVDGPVFVDCNSKGAEMYGFDDKSEIIGLSFMDFASSYQPDGESSAEMTKRIVPIVLNGTPQKINWTSHRRDGTLFSTEVSLNRLVLKGNVYIQAIVRDITERKRLEEEIKSSNALLSAQQEATLDGILAVGPDGKIISYNKRFIEIWKIAIPDEVEATRSDELAMQSVLGLLKEPEEFIKRVNYLYEHRAETSRDEIQLTDGRTLDRYTAPICGADGTYYGRVWYFRDITEMKNLERQKADFYRMVTHDLRTPLATLLGYSTLISENATAKSDEDIKMMADSVTRNGEKLSKLLSDFIAIDAGAGVIKPMCTPVNLAALMKEVVHDFKPLAQQKGVVLRLDVQGGHLVADVDKKLIERAVANLAQNAFNYTPEGGEVTIKAEACSDDGQGRHVHVSVSDTGLGIDPEEQARIFDKYYRSRKVSGIHGTGLGLAVVKEVAEAHGGRVELESEVGKGSTFTLVLPVSQSQP